MTCTNVLRRLNKPYPRTCADCGLGPCQHVEFKGCNIVPLGNKRHDLQALVDDIKAAVFARTGAISVTEAIGALEIAKMEIFKEQ